MYTLNFQNKNKQMKSVTKTISICKWNKKVEEPIRMFLRNNTRKWIR